MNDLKEVLTMGDVAHICHVAPRTASNWFDSGILPGYRVPGSKARRVRRADLLRFMHAHKLPTDRLRSGKTRLLIMDRDAELADVLERVLEQAGYDVEVCQDVFSAGLAAERFIPHVVLVDFKLVRGSFDNFSSALRCSPALQFTKLIVLSDGDAPPGTSEARTLKKPFQISQVVEAVEESLRYPSA